MFDGINYLSNDIQQKSFNADQSIKKISSTGNAIKQAGYNGGGAGSVSFAARLNNSAISKRNSINAFQNAVTYLQVQTDGLRQAERIYHEMLNIAQMSLDPMVGDDQLNVLQKQFNDLREEALNIGTSTFNNNSLFDSRAASTKYSISFDEGLDEKQTPKETSGSTKIWYETKDVVYNSGQLTINVNSGTAGDRYIVKQGEQIIFDTGFWPTEGSAYTTDFDQFILEWDPDKGTNFQFNPQDSNGNGSFDNQPWYANNLSQVAAYDPDPNSSEITVRVESGSLFQATAEYTLPDMEPEFVSSDNNLQVGLHKIGLGLMRVDDSSKDFPLININSQDEASDAIETLVREIDGIAEQMGRVRSNFNRVEISLDAMMKSEASEKILLSRIGDSDITVELLELSKSKISREQSASMMAQAINVNQDVVDILIA